MLIIGIIAVRSLLPNPSNFPIIVGVMVFFVTYLLLVVIFAKKTNRVMSIIIAAFGFISAILAGGGWAMATGEITNAVLGAGFFITGILYSIKAHKLKSS